MLKRPSTSAAKDFSRPEAVIVAPATGSFLLLMTFPLSRTDWENSTIESGRHKHSKMYFLATLCELIDAKVEGQCYGYINGSLRNYYEMEVCRRC